MFYIYIYQYILRVIGRNLSSIMNMLQYKFGFDFFFFNDYDCYSHFVY